MYTGSSLNSEAEDIMDDVQVVQAQPQPLPRGQLALVDEAGLMREFEKQTQQLKVTVQEEFDKRLPLTKGTPPSTKELPKQGATIPWPIWSRPEPQSSHKDEQDVVINALLARNNEHQQETMANQEMYEKLKREYASLKAEHDITTSRLDTTRRELGQERTKTADLESKTASLRSMLIPTSKAQLSDAEVVGKFTALRSQILALVKSTWRQQFRNHVQATELRERIFNPFREGKVEMRYLHNCLRSLVFEVIHCRILDVRHYALGEDFGKVDKALGEVESFMWKNLPESRHKSIIDWRIATWNATKGFRDDKNRLARATRRAIWDFCGILETNGDESEAEGKKRLEKICRDAADLSLVMRNAQDEYAISLIPCVLHNPIEEYEDIVEEEASQPASMHHHPETVARIITGTLLKYPNGSIKDKKVLEKAQAVVYR